MQINIESVVEEVRTAFAAYEAALMANDVEALDRFFWDASPVIRYGVAENLYGPEAIAAYRGSCPAPAGRDLHHTVVTTFGHDLGTANTEYRMPGAARSGRQSQTWVRLAEGWRIVAAHVSLIGESPRVVQGDPPDSGCGAPQKRPEMPIGEPE